MKYTILKVPKIGADFFDILHTFGLSILLANGFDAPVRIINSGTDYECQLQSMKVQNIRRRLLCKTLEVPSENALQDDKDDLLIGNLDGLLAATFTSRGVRRVSVADALQKEKHRPQTLKRSLDKVRDQITRFDSFVKSHSENSSDWMHQLLANYDVTRSIVPRIRNGRTGDISIISTLDPAFGHGTRRPLSDGLITNKSAVTIEEPVYAPILAYIGAARFLRAQRVSGGLVNFYAPAIDNVTLYPDTNMPRLNYFGRGCEQALATQLLRLWKHSPYVWSSMLFQTMQTGGITQSISIRRGRICMKWINNLSRKFDTNLISQWFGLLSQETKDVQFDLNQLVISLLNPTASTWQMHLRDIAIQMNAGQVNIRRYRLSEVKELLNNMESKSSSDLYSVLEKENGTLRFGHSLRQLGEIKPTDLSDITAELDRVNSRDQLIRVIACAVQACVVAKSRSPFMIIPTDDDLSHLLRDVERHGPKDIAGLLIILASLRYPRAEEANSDEERANNTEISKGGD